MRLGAIGLATVGIQNKSLHLKASFMLGCFPFLGDFLQCIAPLVADVDENGQMARPALPWWDSRLEHHQNMHQLHPELSRIIMNHPDTCSSVMRAYTHNQTLLRSSAREGHAWLISSHIISYHCLLPQVHKPRRTSGYHRSLGLRCLPAGRRFS